MFLDPGKLFVIGVVALVVLGPERLPKAARTLGSLWHDVKRLRASLDEQVRQAFPDLPATHEIVAAVRSPLTMLDRLAAQAGETAGSGEAASDPGDQGLGEPRGDPPGNPPGDPPGSAAAADGPGTRRPAGPSGPAADPWDSWPSPAAPGRSPVTRDDADQAVGRPR